ncbi:alpha-xylosidase [Blautia sp. TF11-31AT]|jgi:alpha-D-xyloside xylohydrolase|nr:alpha-xylosidase [Blautia sp. TF11-31AT]
MKFTNGYWLLRDEMKAAYAVEYGSHRVYGQELTMYLPCSHIVDRGSCLNIPLLTVTLSSPMDGVIKVSAVHHDGAVYNGPFAKIYTGDAHVRIEENEEQLIYQTGSLKAVIDKAPNGYKMAFYEEDTFLTESSFRNLAYMQNTKTGKNYMLEQMFLDVDEYVYGLGERFTPFVKNGQVVEMWNEDGGTASEIAYKNIPFYVTNKGYGILVDNEGDVAYEIASEKVERVQFSVEGERLGYYVISGKTPMGTVEKYTELTGKPALPPAWSFGLWLTTSFTTNYDEATTSGFIQGMADREIPLHVFHFDCYWMDAYEWCNFEWDPATFPDPKGMLKRYHDRGLHICVWINPYIGQKSCLFKEGKDHGYLVKKTDGSVWQTDLWQPGMALVDFTNPDAVAWYQGKLKTLLDMGVDCFKTDFGERIPVKEIEYFDHSDPVKMHNYYTYLYNQAVFELLERERGTGEAVLFARSATVGGQQFPAHWGGDCSASYVSMAETLRGGLSLSLGGFGFWSHDISGFESTAPADIYKRWCQFGLLSSHSRLHGSSSYRVPWMFDEEACDILREFVNLKCCLMPYLYGQAVRSHKEGRPVLRPMFLDFPEDRACDTLDRQYMFGDSLLVAPIFKENGEVQYYLPEGTWYNLITGAEVTGGKWQKETHDYHSLPLMIRPNTVLALGNNDQKPDYDYADGVSLLVSAFDEGAEAKTEIPDLKGETVMTVTAKRVGDEIHLHVEGGNGNYTVKSLSGCKVVVEA